MKSFKSILPVLSVITLFGSFVSCEIEEVEPGYELISDYTLNYTNSIGVPLANPVGIASDDENFWIMFGEHNAEEHQLIYYNPETYEIERSFVFVDLIEELGTGVYGITWSGEHVWISVSGNTNKVVKVDPFTGKILQSWSSPTVLGPSDLAFDRGMLWLSSGTGDLYAINPTNGGSELFTEHKHDSHRDLGMLVYADKMWVGDLFDKDIHVYDLDSKEYLGVIKTALYANGKFCLYQGQFVVLDEGGIKFYDIVV
ncbi:MAG: hypothetical protein GQ574_23285 [Crocinitomix sp.]|nr:hypothetical protein [Crocinitomix sp.]